MGKAPAGSRHAGQDDRFKAEFNAAGKLRAKLAPVRSHRAFERLQLTRWRVAQAVLLPLVICTLLWQYRAQLDAFWNACMSFWAVRLQLALPVALGVAAGAPLTLPGEGTAAASQGAVAALLLAASIAAFALSYRLRRAAYPLRFPLRIACVIVGVSVLVWWLSPSLFPVDSAQHGAQLLTMGRALIFATPVMLGMGYYLLHQSLLRKIAYTAVILLFLVLMVPHQVVLHALVLQKLSLLFMPLLYFAFGAIFDALVFVALYAWAASNVPVQERV